jgi:hypothetical protein
MTTASKTDKAAQKRFVFPTLWILGLIMLAGSIYLWSSSSPKPAPVEAEPNPVGFSLGLDDPGLAKIDRQGARVFWQNETRIFPNGYVAGLNMIWPDLERSVTDPTVARVKIIPSGGLFPFYRSDSFAREIEAFVRNGGSLICMGQPLGSMYRALPGAPKGTGWAEIGVKARECYNDAQVATDHPVLAGFPDSTVKLHFGGFFTELPGTDQTQVILRDAATGRPIVAAYRWGEGMVIATTLVSDAAAVIIRIEDTEKLLIDELLAWAEAGGGNLPQYYPGESMEMAYLFLPGQADAVEGLVELEGPGGIEKDSTVTLPEDGGNERKEQLSLRERGIWRVVTCRRNAAGKTVSPSHNFWFVIGHAPAPKPLTGFLGTVTVPGLYLPGGSVQPVLVHLWNENATETQITYSGPGGKHTVKLVPGQYRVLNDEVVFGAAGVQSLSYEFFGASGEKMASIQRDVQTGPPDRLFLSLTTSGLAIAGEDIPVNLQAMAVNPGNFKARCQLRLVHNGKILWQQSMPLEFYNLYAVNTFNLPLPREEHGRLVLEAALFSQNGGKLAESWLEIKVP